MKLKATFLWLKTLGTRLTAEDKKLITSGGWQSDEILDAGHKLLKSMHTHIQGLQELFAIAFATSLARGEQPGSFFYEQKATRKHLIESLEKQNNTAFPIQKIRRHGSKVRHSANVPIHCVCKLPKLEGIKMIECSYCGAWYHIDLCVSVSSDFQQPHTCIKWACVKCKSWTEN